MESPAVPNAHLVVVMVVVVVVVGGVSRGWGGGVALLGLWESLERLSVILEKH